MHIFGKIRKSWYNLNVSRGEKMNNDELLKELEEYFNQHNQNIPDSFKQLINEGINTYKQDGTKLNLVAKPKYSNFGNFLGYDINLAVINNFITDLKPDEFILAEIYDWQSFFDQPAKLISELVTKYYPDQDNNQMQTITDQLVEWAQNKNYYDEYAYTLMCKRINDNLDFRLARNFERSDEINSLKLLYNNQVVMNFGVYFDLE